MLTCRPGCTCLYFRLCGWGAIDPRIRYRPKTHEYYLTWDNCTFECAFRSSMLSVSKVGPTLAPSHWSTTPYVMQHASACMHNAGLMQSFSRWSAGPVQPRELDSNRPVHLASCDAPC